MPGISDPGSWLVEAAIAAGVPVFPIPGANAALSALIASGLSTEQFHFLGFLPEKAGARRTRLEELAAQSRDSAATLIFYEAPHRIADTLADLESVFGPGSPRRGRPRTHQAPRRIPPRHRRRSPSATRRPRPHPRRIRSSHRSPRQKFGCPRSGFSDPGDHLRPQSPVSSPNPISTKKKPSSGWRASWASRKASYTANCSASAPAANRGQQNHCLENDRTRSSRCLRIRDWVQQNHIQQ